MDLRPVFILTAAFGEGHKTAAHSLAEALSMERPGIECEVLDPFANAYPARNRLAAWGYAVAINRAPAVWALAFQALDKTSLAPSHIGIYWRALRLLDHRIGQIRPPIIVSTYPGCGHLLDRICRRRVCRPFRTVTIVTDSISVNTAWHTAYADAFCVADDLTRGIIEGRGVPAGKIHPFGFPVSPTFARLEGKRSPGPPWRVLYVVNGQEERAPRLAAGLSAIEDVHLVVAVGRRPRLETAIRRKCSGRDVEVVGWVPDLPERMASSHFFVGKAGGACVHECLAAGLPLILTQVVPGQEEGNAELVTRLGAGLLANHDADAVEAVRSAIRDGGVGWRRMADSAMAAGKPCAARDIARFTLQIAQL